jgi:hypothetical protein
MARQVWAEVQRGNDPRETLPWLKNRAAARRGGGTAEGAFDRQVIRGRYGVDFQIRDIRRTVATRMAEDLGISPFIIAKVMDHKLPGEAEMGEVYNRYDYMPEKRRALTRWCDHLDNIRADRRTRKVVSMTPTGVE